MTDKRKKRTTFNTVSPRKPVKVSELEEAVVLNRPETVQALLEAGESADQKDRNGTDLMLRAMRMKDTTIAQLLITYGYDVNKRSKNGVTPLMQASNHGFPQMAQMLLDNGAEIDAASNKGVTALMYTVLQDNLPVAELLIKRAARMDLCDKQGRTAGSIAEKLQRTEIITLLEAAAKERRLQAEQTRKANILKSQSLLYADAGNYTIRRRPVP